MNWVAVVDKEALYLNVPKYLQTDDCEKDRTFVMQKSFCLEMERDHLSG